MSWAAEVTTGPIPIGQFVALIKSTLKRDPLFQHQILKGEVSGLKLARSGHTYFDLRDDQGQMNCAIWKNRCHIDASIKNGSEVVVIASIDVYAPRGSMTLTIEKIEPISTIGALEEARRKLVSVLRADGSLDRMRLQIPMIPKHIVIITGAKSAALADMQRIIENRWPGLRRSVIGVTVQGESAAGQICQALAAAREMSRPEVAKKMNRPVVDLIIIARGGGSPEDLWAFNLESVARAIIASPVPVISAIGHESDMLVSDLVADLRASTPSNAIERCVPEKNDIMMWLSDIDTRLENSVLRRFGESRQHLISLTARLRLAPMAGLSKAKDRLNNFEMRIKSSSQKMLSGEKTRLSHLAAILQSSHPKRVLERGYSMVQTKDGEVLSSVSNVVAGQEINLTFADGSALANIKKIIEDDENE